MRPLSVKRVFKSSSPQHCTVTTCLIRPTWFISLVETQRHALSVRDLQYFMTKIEKHWFSSLARGYMSKWWTCTPMSPVAHVASVPSAGSRVHPREGEESREEAEENPSDLDAWSITDSWSTGLVTQGCIPLYLGGNGGLWLHISCKPSLGRTLWFCM